MLARQAVERRIAALERAGLVEQHAALREGRVEQADHVGREPLTRHFADQPRLTIDRADAVPAVLAFERSAREQRPFALDGAADGKGGTARLCLERLGSRLERLCAGPRRTVVAQGVVKRGR